MKINKIIEKRRSVREYKDKEIDKLIIEDLFETIKNRKKLKEDIEIDFYFLKNGEEAFHRLNGLVGYYGKVIKAPHYIAIVSEVKEGYLENAGYIGEEIVLKATELGLGTCWIEVPEDDKKVKEVLDINNGHQLISLLAIGYAKKERKVLHAYDTTKKGSISPLTELGYPEMSVEYAKNPVSSRLSVKDMVYLEEWGKEADIEELEHRGIAEVLYYVRLAPSWGNRQPWKFIVDGGRIVLTISKDGKDISEKVAKIEAGIVMLYFEIMAHEMGIKGQWVLGKNHKDYKIPDDYFIAGYYAI